MGKEGRGILGGGGGVWGGIRKEAYLSRQCHSAARWESLGQRALKASNGLGSFMDMGFVLSMDSRC